MKTFNLIYIAQHALEIFMKLRWPDGVYCPKCKAHNIIYLKDGRYKCKECGKVFSDKTDTLFEGSKLPVSYWIIALYLTVIGKGISSYELAKKLCVTQKTAYYMQMRLRQSFLQDDLYLESPVVAHDEVFIGGDYRHFCLRRRQELIEKFNLPKAQKTIKEKIALGNAINHRTKKAVFGITDGDIAILKQVPTPIEQKDILKIYKKHVSRNGLAVADCSLLYKNWDELTGRELHTNNHSKGQYKADNGTSSNMIENVFSWLERSNIFVHVHYSRAYTQLYLDEFAFRFNTRKMNNEERLTIAVKNCIRKYNRCLLKTFNECENKLYRKDKFFNPDEFFKKYGSAISEYSEGGLIYRREDYV